VRLSIAQTRADQAREAAAELAGVWKEKRESSITIDEQVGFRQVFPDLRELFSKMF
jgi:hypothetical protein